MDDDAKKPLLYGADGKPLPLTNSTTQEHISNRVPPESAGKAKGSAKRSRKYNLGALKVVLTLLGVAGTLVTLYALYPKVSVIPNEYSYDDHNPFRVPLHIVNNGQFWISDGSIVCNDMHFDDASNNSHIENVVTTAARDVPVGNLGPGGSTMTGCPDQLMYVNSGDKFVGRMTVVLSFRPSLWPKRISREFRMLATSESDGHIHWNIVSK